MKPPSGWFGSISFRSCCTMSVRHTPIFFFLQNPSSFSEKIWSCRIIDSYSGDIRVNYITAYQTLNLIQNLTVLMQIKWGGKHIIAGHAEQTKPFYSKDLDQVQKFTPSSQDDLWIVVEEICSWFWKLIYCGLCLTVSSAWWRELAQMNIPH